VGQLKIDAAKLPVNEFFFKLLIQYESSKTAQVGGSDFSAMGNAKYIKICLVVCTGCF
jgi:hypothetical protein